MSSPREEPRVVFTPSPEEADFSALGATIFELAGELDAAEGKVRRALLAALDRGDVGYARQIVERWTKEPIEELAAHLKAGQ